MTFYASATVDLDNFVSPAARRKFNEELRKKNFTKHKLTTLWTVSFTPSTSREWAENYVRDSINTAALFAGISTFEAFVTVSEAPPIEWKKSAVESLLGAMLRQQN
ncbi:hypothetical protein D9M71_577020 [compost metagenome]